MVNVDGNGQEVSFKSPLSIYWTLTQIISDSLLMKPFAPRAESRAKMRKKEATIDEESGVEEVGGGSERAGRASLLFKLDEVDAQGVREPVCCA